ncbi:MAG TPA: HTH domain-containing protein [Actinomycetota bacterium]|nr:HTH domain-containing protein [Actinomycetota bacterium]
MGVKEDLEAVLERTPRTPEDAEAMQEAASILASYLRLEEQVARLSGRSKRGEEAVRDQGSLRGLTLHEAARRVLLRAGVPLHARELGTRIKAGGWTHPRSRVARPEQIVFQLAARLPRHPDTFVRVAPNTFGLVEWGERDAPPRPRPRLGVFLGPGRAVGREIGDSDEPVAGEAWSWRSS